MIPGFEAIVEERIRKAQKEGRFNNLPGRSKPLKFEPDQGPEEWRMANKILKNAGFVPPAVELRKEISQTREALSDKALDKAAQNKLLKRLNYLTAKLDSTTPGRSAGLLDPVYGKAVMKKLL